ncbi:extracellular solute-binding protein [Cohnella abietis]|uniref:ABC transporter substrate-binding protein n=1 Tax=Cohnella abietis TaxID=2507935 RepID=A0A3T1D0N7_9BACL|nr:extracellular solute-binding protein [Cohnella abietis]BBI31569.1 ABC transporter substrate-binding protein [Cohnella abietis]
MSRKRMGWSRWVALTLVLALSAMIAACGSGTKNNEGASAGNSTSPSAANTESQQPANDPQVEITIWDQVNPDDIGKLVGEELQKGFEEKYPNIIVKHELPPNGTNDREVFVTAMAGGNGPDAYSVAYFPVIGDWVKQGFALDLSDYWNGLADKDQYLKSAMEGATIDGKVYGIPNFMYATGLLYNKKLFADVGLDPNKAPANWDEFAEYAQKLTKPEKNQYGYALLGMDWADWWFEYYVWQAGGDLTTRNADGTVTLDFSKEPAVKALQYYKDLKWKYKGVQKNVLQGIDENKTDFFQGRAAMILFGSDGFAQLVQNGIDLNDIGFAPFPVGPAGKAPSQVGGQYWIVNPKTSKEKQDAAFKYVEYMTSKEALEKMLTFQSDNGIMPNLLSVRNDVDPSTFVQNVPAGLVAGVRKAAESTQLEYFLKERLSPYVVKAVQKVLVDEKADPLTELKAVEELAQREVADPYNKEIKE